MTNTSLTSQQLAECREAFVMLDKDGEGQLPAESLGRLIRMIGQNPSEAEIRELSVQLTRCDPSADSCSSSRAMITCDDFCCAVARRLAGKVAVSHAVATAAPATAELEEAFRALDRRLTGRLAATRLKALLTSFGEPLTPAEVDELLLMAKPASGGGGGGDGCGDDDGEVFVDYRSLARRLLTK